MKITALLIFICMLTMQINAQTNIIDINDIEAFINNNGTISFEDEESHFEVPKGSGDHTIFAGQVWMGGIDDGGQLHVAAQTYRQSGDDFWAGPIADDYTASVYADTYERVWIIDKASIEDHKLNWDEGGYIVPDAIIDWPGNGNTTNGEAEFLAPFYDYNVNEIYDPENGDYPIIRGDEALFFIMNDDANEHTESEGEKLGVEIHGMAYAFDTPSADTALFQTLFLHYEIINRSANNYNDFYTGTWFDFDIGCWTDDWVGCDSSLNLFYAYNGDVNDEPCPGGYDSYPPAQGAVWLNENLSSFIYYNNDYTVIGNPENADDYYNYLKATWKDDLHVTYGGDGYGGVDETNFMFPSDPLDEDGWSELTETNAPADRRGVGATGPFLLQPGQSLCYDIALPFAFRDGTGHLEMISVLRQRTQDVIDFYSTNFSVCKIENETNPDFDTTLSVEQEVLIGVEVFPNPAKNNITIDLGNSFLMRDAKIEILNTVGEILISKENIAGNSITINDLLLPQGLYFYNLKEANSIIASGSFTVQ
ncbi:MAG: T9SS type A sorting domain-containing protein [Fimbriimonadaceae bacterium]|nr:T9SS type A sorting domain-containing protein [Chitinophagales bacterium]